MADKPNIITGLKDTYMRKINESLINQGTDQKLQGQIKFDMEVINAWGTGNSNFRSLVESTSMTSSFPS